MKKLFLISALLLSIVLITGCTQEKEEEKEEISVTYDNSIYGYKFKYDPDKYEIAESKSRGGANDKESDLVVLKEKSEENCPKSVEIFISKATLEEELKDLEFRINGQTTDVKIDKVEAKKRLGTLTEHQPPCGNEVTEIVFEYQDTVYTVKANKNSENLLNKTLDTFLLQ